MSKKCCNNFSTVNENNLKIKNIVQRETNYPDAKEMLKYNGGRENSLFIQFTAKCQGQVITTKL